MSKVFAVGKKVYFNGGFKFARFSTLTRVKHGRRSPMCY